MNHNHLQRQYRNAPQTSHPFHKINNVVHNFQQPSKAFVSLGHSPFKNSKVRPLLTQNINPNLKSRQINKPFESHQEEMQRQRNPFETPNQQSNQHLPNSQKQHPFQTIGSQYQTNTMPFLKNKENEASIDVPIFQEDQCAYYCEPIPSPKRTLSQPQYLIPHIRPQTPTKINIPTKQETFSRIHDYLCQTSGTNHRYQLIGSLINQNHRTNVDQYSNPIADWVYDIQYMRFANVGTNPLEVFGKVRPDIVVFPQRVINENYSDQTDEETEDLEIERKDYKRSTWSYYNYCNMEKGDLGKKYKSERCPEKKGLVEELEVPEEEEWQDQELFTSEELLGILCGQMSESTKPSKFR